MPIPLPLRFHPRFKENRKPLKPEDCEFHVSEDKKIIIAGLYEFPKGFMCWSKYELVEEAVDVEKFKDETNKIP